MDTSDAPRWLDADERQAWLALASVVIRLPGSLDAQLLRMSDVAAFAEASLPRLSQVVSRLERRGWVCRRPDPTDGRYTLATLTAEGWDKVVESAPGHVEAVRRLVFDPLTRTQVRQLTDIGRRIMGAIDPASDCGGSVAR